MGEYPRGNRFPLKYPYFSSIIFFFLLTLGLFAFHLFSGVSGSVGRYLSQKRAREGGREGACFFSPDHCEKWRIDGRIGIMGKITPMRNAFSSDQCNRGSPSNENQCLSLQSKRESLRSRSSWLHDRALTYKGNQLLFSSSSSLGFFFCILG